MVHPVIPNERLIQHARREIVGPVDAGIVVPKLLYVWKIGEVRSGTRALDVVIVEKIPHEESVVVTEGVIKSGNELRFR